MSGGNSLDEQSVCDVIVTALFLISFVAFPIDRILFLNRCHVNCLKLVCLIGDLVSCLNFFLHLFHFFCVLFSPVLLFCTTLLSVYHIQRLPRTVKDLSLDFIFVWTNKRSVLFCFTLLCL